MKCLQGISQDLSCSLRMTKECQRKCVALCDNDDKLDAFSERIYSHSCQRGARSDITPGMPRIRHRQQHWSNSQYSEPKEYFKVTFLVLFLDHLIADLHAQFSKHVQTIAHLQALFPTTIKEASSFEDIKEAVVFNCADLPNLKSLTRNLLAGRESG